MTDDLRKDPEERLDYTQDWSDCLKDEEVIISSVMTPSVGIVVDDSSYTATTATAWLTGGTTGVYAVKNVVTTNEGRIYTKSMFVRVIDK